MSWDDGEWIIPRSARKLRAPGTRRVSAESEGVYSSQSDRVAIDGREAGTSALGRSRRLRAEGPAEIEKLTKEEPALERTELQPDWHSDIVGKSTTRSWRALQERGQRVRVTRSWDRVHRRADQARGVKRSCAYTGPSSLELL